MRLISNFILFILVLSSCSIVERRVEINTQYIINPYWTKVDNSFAIVRMVLPNSVNSESLEGLSKHQAWDTLIPDSSFFFTSNVKYNGTPYPKRKVYFGRKNGFTWYRSSNPNMPLDQIPELEPNYWYKLLGIGRDKSIFYIFVDSTYQVHYFDYSASYWTNY